MAKPDELSRGHAITAIVPTRMGGCGSARKVMGCTGWGKRWRKCEKLSGLPSAWIRTLFLDGRGTLWIGTAGGGLSRLQNTQIATFTMREGLPDNTISQIFEDDDGNLWLGGNRGIARVKKRDF